MIHRNPSVPARGIRVVLQPLTALGLAALALAAAAPAAAQYPSLKVELLARVPGLGNDCWGYVSPSGREYAIMGERGRTRFIEITDPRNPVVVGEVSHPNCTWSDMKTYSHYAYVVTECGSNVQIVDMGQIDSGVVSLIGTFGPGSSHNVAIDTDSGFLYTLGSSGGATTTVWDLSNPASPARVGSGSLTVNYQHDAQIVTYTSGPYAGKQILFGASEGRGLQIYDVTNKNSPVLLAQRSYPNVSYCHQGWLSEDRRYFYINDELDEVNHGLPHRTIIFEVSDLANPRYVGFFSSGLPHTDHNLYVKGDFIYEANYRGGLQIFDACDPENPVMVGYIDTVPGSNAAGFEGAWSTYPYFPSGIVIVNDTVSGLFIVDVTEAISGEGPLTFDYPVGRPELIDPAGGTSLSVDISGCRAQPNPATATLHYDDGGGFLTAPMNHLGGGVFEAVFPKTNCGSPVAYYVSIESAGGVVHTSPSEGPGRPFFATSASDIVTFFHDDFSSDKGWKVGAIDDDAVRGIWNRMMPEQTSTGAGIAQPGFTPTGTACYVTDGRAGSSAGAWDVDEGKTTVFSPIFDLDGKDPIVGYYRWYSNHAGANPHNDIFVVDVSNDGGETWSNVETVGPDGPEARGDWYYTEHTLSAIITPTNEVQFRFVASDYDPQALVEACIDDFRIEQIVCDTCYPDCDGNSQLDFFDFLCFQNAFLAGDPYADCDGNSQLNFFDFLCFQNEFLAGCP
jgi:choice-of-anchor B domain-containing protein